jgi:hypothetical protein
MNLPERSPGHTTKQMQDAPQRAVFVSCNPNRVRYDTNLATFLGRNDLTVVDTYWLTGRKWAGLDLTAIVIDHKARLNPRERNLLTAAMTRVRSAA